MVYILLNNEMSRAPNFEVSILVVLFFIHLELKRVGYHSRIVFFFIHLELKRVGGNTDNVTLFLECSLKLASTTEFHVECNTLHYNETAKHCGVTSLLPAGCYIHGECNKISL